MRIESNRNDKIILIKSFFLKKRHYEYKFENEHNTKFKTHLNTLMQNLQEKLVLFLAMMFTIQVHDSIKYSL